MKNLICWWVLRMKEGLLIHAQSTRIFRLESLLIPEIRNCNTNYFFASFDCDWEEEHGMQVLIADGEIILCGESTSLPFSSQWIHVISLPDKKKQIDFLKTFETSNPA